MRVLKEGKRYLKIDWTYDSNNRLKEYEIKVITNKEKQILAAPNLYKKLKYEYDQNGMVAKETEEVFAAIGGGCKRTFKYDQFGNRIEQIIDGKSNFYLDITNPSRLGQDESYTIVTYIYEYDSQGNWISKKTNMNNIFLSVTTREISYWE